MKRSLITLTLAILVGTPATLLAGANCGGTVCAGGMCTLTASATGNTTGGVAVSGLMIYGPGYTSILPSGVSNALCVPLSGAADYNPSGGFTVMLMATHTPTTAQPAFCSWVVRAVAFAAGTQITCRVDGGDGLPVELMDFSVEGESTAQTGG